MIFKSGDLVIMQHAGYHTEWNGFPAVIEGGLRPRTSMDLTTMERRTCPSYRVRILTHERPVVTARPHQVRPFLDPNTPISDEVRNLLTANVD